MPLQDERCPPQDERWLLKMKDPQDKPVVLLMCSWDVDRTLVTNGGVEEKDEKNDGQRWGKEQEVTKRDDPLNDYIAYGIGMAFYLLKRQRRNLFAIPRLEEFSRQCRISHQLADESESDSVAVNTSPDTGVSHRHQYRARLRPLSSHVTTPAPTLATVRPGFGLLHTSWLRPAEFNVNGDFPLTVYPDRSDSGDHVPVFYILEFKCVLSYPKIWNDRSGTGLGYQDPWWIKTLVAFLFIVNITQAAAVVYMSWFYCVTNFANPGVVASKNSLPGEKPHLKSVYSVSLWPYPFTYLTTAVLAITNQMFQSWRIYLFTGSRIRVGFLVVASLAACGTGVASAIEAWIFSELAKLVVLQPIVEVQLTLQCAIDVILAVYSNSKTTIPRTDKVLNRLIRTAVQSGFFTGGWSGTHNERYDGLSARGISAVFALGILFSFRFSPGTYMIALFTFPIGRIYTHTMMDHFISREPLRNSLSNSGNILTVPNFDAAGEESSGAANGTLILLRNVSTRTNATKTNETV
ncbi:hypothetical protein DFH08DRAFT_1002552 [Mycena albidolilacea]|uniref:Uncharacterized protein n=1 Tax=Mycena albidolilacea TaxID=1033008 RepID=A0AAD7ESB3_9AGAR|nr:hypothetical protein DFH08DRAFT_1002552 [Mycena albidolilacea]